MRRRVRPVRSLRRPTVSVVVPCYNYARYLRDAVDSVLSQEGVDVDVLIVDDYSSDGSAEVASSLAAGDERVRVIVHGQNVGHIATYNEGLASVAGDYVVLLSADDMLTPGALAGATSLMEARPNVRVRVRPCQRLRRAGAGGAAARQGLDDLVGRRMDREALSSSHQLHPIA